MREVFVWPPVQNKLWQLLSETAYRKVRDRLIEQLEGNYDRLRTLRHPDDETVFVYVLNLADGESWHTFEFHVDDTTADTCLIVLDVVHTLGKNRLF